MSRTLRPELRTSLLTCLQFLLCGSKAECRVTSPHNSSMSGGICYREGTPHTRNLEVPQALKIGAE